MANFYLMGFICNLVHDIKNIKNRKRIMRNFVYNFAYFISGLFTSYLFLIQDYYEWKYLMLAIHIVFSIVIGFMEMSSNSNFY